MKSNEEFIAGIYEKAASYTEDKETNISKVNRASKAARIAAMAAVCIGLAGVGTMVFGKGNNQVPTKTPAPSDNYGIALTSETGEELTGGAARLRIGSVVETVTFTGVVECVDAEEKRIWIKLLFDATAPEYVENSVICIKWDVLEPVSENVVVGKTVTATGALSRYENEASENNGCAELVLTDINNLEVK